MTAAARLWVVVVAVAAIGVAGFFLLCDSGEPTVRVVARFDSVRGLVEGGEVRANGVEVGTVKKVRLGADGRPEVTFDVRRDYRLRADGTATVRVPSLSGEFNRYVGLTQGSSGRVLASGDSLTHTASPTEVDEALDRLTPPVRADLKATLAGLDTAMRGRGPDVDRTLRSSAAALGETADALHDLQADGAALRGVIADVASITGALEDHRPELQASIRTTSTLLGRTTARRQELAASLAGLPEALRRPRLALAEADQVIQPARRLVRDLAPAVAQLRPASGELARAAVAARPALRQGRGLVRTGPADLRTLTPVLKQAAPVLKTLTGALSQANPILDQTRVRLPDFFSFFANWADFTAAYDANGHGARVGIVLPPTSTRTLEPDQTHAGQLAAPFLRTPGALEGVPWEDYADSFVGGGVKGPDVK